MRFEFPLPTGAWSTNEDRNLNPYTRADRIKHWKMSTYTYYRKEQGRGVLALPPGIVQVHIPFNVERRRDPHNYCGTVVKAVIDGLVKAGAWPDDTPNYVGHREPVLYKGTQVIVEITPIQELHDEELDTGNDTAPVAHQG